MTNRMTDRAAEIKSEGFWRTKALQLIEAWRNSSYAICSRSGKYDRKRQAARQMLSGMTR
ncbi:hypothetical protein H7Q97_12055 [Ochrobactrum sp. CM-21-5]|nr:hypothetical protein [Ochrobactrum sp. CM-21-5]MBC2886124.1 hypothetical protein [Ochrobactrum sp. CM-21-5]